MSDRQKLNLITSIRDGTYQPTHEEPLREPEIQKAQHVLTEKTVFTYNPDGTLNQIVTPTKCHKFVWNNNLTLYQILTSNI